MLVSWVWRRVEGGGPREVFTYYVVSNFEHASIQNILPMREGWPKNEKIRVIIVCILEVKKTSEFQFLVQTRRKGEIFSVSASPWLWSGVGTLERCKYLWFEYSLVEMWGSSNYHQWRTVVFWRPDLSTPAHRVTTFVVCLYGKKGAHNM